MNTGPILLRELRSEARSPGTQRTRAFAAALALGVLILVVLTDGLDPRMGKQLFLLLHTVMYLAIWMLVPLILHDTLCRERREGTLGLLLLTPLTGAGIILSKALVGLLRSSGIMLATVPVVALPILLGGVSPAELGRAVLMEVMALLGASAAAILGSAFSVRRQRALLASALWALLFMSLLAGTCFALLGGFNGWTTAHLLNPFEFLTGLLGGGFLAATRVDVYAAPIGVSLMVVALAALLLVGVLLLAGARLKELATATGPTARQLRLFKMFCTPVIFGDFLKQRLESALNRNPIGWLQQRRWTSRLSRWGWLAVLLVTATWAVSVSSRGLFTQLLWLAVLLGANVCLSAAGSFRDERQNGALELLMVTPLSGRDILLGRLRGIRGQFLLPFALWAWIWWFVGTYHHNADYYRWSLLWHGGLLVTGLSLWWMPVIGVHQSLVSRTLLGGWLKTLFLGLVIPGILALMLAGTIQAVHTNAHFDATRRAVLAGLGAHVAVLVWFARRSWRSVATQLDERAFVATEDR